MISTCFILQDQRVPADMVFVRTTEKSGSCFIRTDQLDGETDWKLRLAVQNTQNLHSNVVGLYLHFNPNKLNGLSHPYHLDESTFILRDFRSNFQY